jgi:hypothetical protein
MFKIQKYSEALRTVALGYRGLTKIIFVDKYVNLSWAEYNFSFTNAEFLIIIMNQHRIESISDCSFRRANCTADSDSSKNYILHTYFRLWCNVVYNYSLISNSIKIKMLHVSAILVHPQGTAHLLKLLHCISF